MPEFTIADLVRLLRECAGEDESVDLNGDIQSVTFDDLGYDSLALFNTVGRIERDYAISLPEDVVSELLTPQELIAEVNQHLEQPA
ncbi:acyl carrier protein [Nocardiopsis sediminis]|uniref:Acyl carrier protein n=1 Tax=Nocardiopsis sediminis TaxID=1778267 RepID=A0ABV8FV16_9ACTN